MANVDKLLRSKKVKERFAVGGMHTVIPLVDYRFAKFKVNFKENGKDKTLFIVLEKNKFKKALLDNCREYRLYDIKKDEFVEEEVLDKRFFRKCPNGCGDSELIIVEKPNAELYDKKDLTSWIFRDIWRCGKCKGTWLVTCHPETGDDFEEVKFVKLENRKRVYKTINGKEVKFDRSPSKV